MVACWAAAITSTLQSSVDCCRTFSMPLVLPVERATASTICVSSWGIRSGGRPMMVTLVCTMMLLPLCSRMLRRLVALVSISVAVPRHCSLLLVKMCAAAQVSSATACPYTVRLREAAGTERVCCTTMPRVPVMLM